MLLDVEELLSSISLKVESSSDLLWFLSDRLGAVAHTSPINSYHISAVSFLPFSHRGDDFQLLLMLMYGRLVLVTTQGTLLVSRRHRCANFTSRVCLQRPQLSYCCIMTACLGICRRWDNHQGRVSRLSRYFLWISQKSVLARNLLYLEQAASKGTFLRMVVLFHALGVLLL